MDRPWLCMARCSTGHPSVSGLRSRAIFFPTGVLILVGHGVSGLWTREVLQLYAYSLPLIALAFLLGTRLDHALPPRSFERAIYVFLMCIGLLLIV